MPNPVNAALALAVWLACSPAIPSALPAADWPRLGGPDGAGISPETGLARAWPAGGPRVLWSVPIGEGYAGPAIRDGLVYLLDRAGEEKDVLRCLELATGRELWRLDFVAPGKLPHPGSRNVPTVDQEYLYAVGPFGQLYCVDRRSHQPVWVRHLVDDFKDPQIDRAEPPEGLKDRLARAQVPMWGMTQAPLLYRDLVIVAPQTQKVGVVAYEKRTGKIRWQSGYIGRNWYGHVSPCLVRLGGVEQVIMLAQPSDPEKYPPAIVSGITPESGQILWQTQTPGPLKIPMAQPLQLDEHRLFLTGGYRLGQVILQVNRTNGQWNTRVLLHNKDAVGHIHSPVLYRNHIYLTSFKEHGATNTGLVCLDLQGRALWQTGPELRFDNGPLLLVDDLALVMNGKTGELHLFAISPTAGKLLASALVLDDKKPWAPMALSDGKLLVRNLEILKCLDLKNP